MDVMLSCAIAKLSGNVLILFTHHPDNGRKAQSRRYDFRCELPKELKELQTGTAFEVCKLNYQPHSNGKAPVICYDKDKNIRLPKGQKAFKPPCKDESEYDCVVFLSLKDAKYLRKQKLLSSKRLKKLINVPVTVNKVFFDHLLEGLVYAPAGLGLHPGRCYRPRENSTLAVIGRQMVIGERFPCCFCLRMIQRHGFYVRRIKQLPEGRLQLPRECYFFDSSGKCLLIPYAVPRAACKTGVGKKSEPITCCEAQRREGRTLTSAVIPDGFFLPYELYHATLLEKIYLCSEGKLSLEEARELIRALWLYDEESPSLVKTFMTIKLICHRKFMFKEHKPVAYDKLGREYAQKHGLKTAPDTPAFWSAAVLSAAAEVYFFFLYLTTGTEVFWGRKGVGLIFRLREQFRGPAEDSVRRFYESASDTS